MPIRPFKNLPKDVVEWARYLNSTPVIPDPDSVGAAEIQNRAVTYQKIQEVTPSRLLGRITSPAGTAQEIEVGDGLEFTSTGIQRSELTGDVIAPAGSSDTEFRELSACSVLGRTQNTVGTPGDIVAAVNGYYLRRTSNTLEFGSIADSDIPSTIARDTEVTSAISTAISDHEAAGDPHPGYTTAAELTSALSALNLASGTYTPTLTNTTNLDGSTAFETSYMRVGATVTVGGIVNIDPTAAAEVVMGMSLPVASDFASQSDCGGTGACIAVQQTAGIWADTTNNRAEFRFIANDTTARTFTFSFTYRII